MSSIDDTRRGNDGVLWLSPRDHHRVRDGLEIPAAREVMSRFFIHH